MEELDKLPYGDCPYEDLADIEEDLAMVTEAVEKQIRKAMDKP